MKRVLAAAVLLGSLCFAQQPTAPAPTGSTGPSVGATADVTEQLVPVSMSDIYCSGVMTDKPVSRANFVVGGLGTPDQVRFGERDLIYIKGTYQPGTLVSVLREWRTEDTTEFYQGVRKMQKEAGQPYLDEGYAKVIEQRGEFAVARVQFSCDPIVNGDLVVPFQERPLVKVRQRTTANRFPVASGGLNGKIVMVREGDHFAAVGRKVFLNLGSEKGVKPGDYFQVVRGYTADVYDAADKATLSSTITDDTQKNPPKIADRSELPQRLVGELVVLNVQDKTATAMVTFMLEEIHAGDAIQMEQAQ